MTIDEAIAHCFEVAERYETQEGCQECSADHRQLAEWLTNYKEAMRLLKSAIDEWHIVCEWGKCGEYCGWYVNGQCSQKWSGEAEALKLIES